MCAVEVATKNDTRLANPRQYMKTHALRSHEAFWAAFSYVSFVSQTKPKVSLQFSLNLKHCAFQFFCLNCVANPYKFIHRWLNISIAIDSIVF